ncbi:MAG: DNA-formamidopyrimidine glycosylase family protein, partial [Nocardioides sp.]
MPELPEIETFRRGLERETVGRRVKSVEVPVAKTVHRNGSRKAFQG